MFQFHARDADNFHRFLKKESLRIIHTTGLNAEEANKIALAHWRRMIADEDDDTSSIYDPLGVKSENPIDDDDDALLSPSTDPANIDFDEEPKSEYDIFMATQVQRIKETQYGVSHLRALQIAAGKWKQLQLEKTSNLNSGGTEDENIDTNETKEFEDSGENSKSNSPPETAP